MKSTVRHALLKPSLHHHHRTLSDAPSIKWVRDRALDHAVEKERNLKPMLNLKTLINYEPSKSLPLSIIAQNRHSLKIPIRPIDFIRKYPSIFQEFLPGGIGINPHVKLTSEVLDLDAEEQLVYQTENHKQEVADRLLKLLMIGRINKIPLCLLECLKFDLGLPQDYTQSVVPEFPDYFQVTGNAGNGDLSLELVCWSNDLAVSVIEKKAMRSAAGYRKGMPIAFPLQYSRGFEMDKKFKKWVDDWQKLPYISPYENGFNLPAKSDESDKWAVSVLHEVLNLFVPKKTEKDNILYLGEYLGLRSRFKRALLQHPGIFYISSKVRTHTVVLREAYKRDLLIGKHPLMDMRSKYIHLMYQVKEGDKSKSGQKTGPRKAAIDSKEGEGEEVEGDESGEEQDEQLGGNLDSEFEDESDDDDYVDEEDESDDNDEGESVMNRGRLSRHSRIEVKRPLANVSNRSARGNPNKIRDPKTPRFSGRGEKGGGRNVRGRSQERLDVPRSRGRTSRNQRAST
ncbi:hypothetical protein LguiA_018101 [Lonicera macranthoides]